MKERVLCKVILAISLCLCMAVPALADIGYGDTGDEVVNLQTLLFETGWLFELPDGKFGRNTEQAVKNYQQYAGFEVTGVMTDAMIAQLTEDWYLLVYGSLPEGYERTASGGDFYYQGSEMYPAFCNHWNMQDGNSEIDYCETHMNLRLEVARLTSTGDTSDARQACDIWRAEIVRLYDEWASLVDESEKGSILAARALYLSSMEAQRLAVDAWHENFQIVPDESNLYSIMETSMREQAAWLCAMLSTSYVEGE